MTSDCKREVLKAQTEKHGFAFPTYKMAQIYDSGVWSQRKTHIERTLVLPPSPPAPRAELYYPKFYRLIQRKFTFQ